MRAALFSVVSLLLLLPGAQAARDAPAISFHLIPGARLSLAFERRREVWIDGSWLFEGASRMQAEWRVEAAEGEGLRLRWVVRRITQAQRSPTRQDLAFELLRMNEGLELVYAGDREGRPLRLLNRDRVRAFLATALARTLERLRRQLMAEGYPPAAIEEVLSFIEQRFEEMHRRDDATFDRMQLRDVRLVTEFAGTSLASLSPTFRAERPVPWREEALAMEIRDRLETAASRADEGVLAREERPLEPISKREILPRFPSLVTALARMPEKARARVVAELPDPGFARTTRLYFDAATGLPRRIARSEVLRLGTLRRRMRTIVRIEPRPR